jgi:phosphoglycerol transferase MdoB-like AlkP superfamily enzyme
VSRCRHLVWAIAIAFLLLAPRPAKAAPDVAFALEAHETPATLCPAEGRPVALTLRNTGSVAWDPALKDRVAYHWLAADGTVIERDGRRSMLPGVVQPGDVVEVSAVVVAPKEAGAYRLEWAMVRESVRWYPAAEHAEVPIEVAGDGAALAWAVIDIGDVDIAALGEAEVAVKLDNRGCATWSPSTSDHLSYRWTTPGGEVVAEGIRTTLPGDVPSGESVSTALQLAGPPKPGPHVLVVEPVREGVAWFGAPAEGDASVAVDVTEAALAWSLLEGGTVAELGSGSAALVDLTLRNVGTQTWSPESGDRVSYRWQQDGAPLPIEGERTALPHPVAPGETVNVRVRVVAPEARGTYALHIQPVREGVAWYGPPRQAPWSGAMPTTEVGPPDFAWSLVEADPQWLAWSGRTTEIEVVVRNDGRLPWSPEEGDRASYRILDEDGRVIVADGKRTPLLEVVEPGATATLTIELTVPETPGLYTVELGLLREHVQWFRAQGDVRIPLRGRWRSASWGCVALVVMLGLLGLERMRLAPREKNRVFELLARPLWTAVAVWLLAELFAELSGLVMWEGGSPTSASVGALMGLLVALIPPRRQIWAALFIVALWSVIALADLAYVRFFGSIAPLSALAAAHHLSDARATVGSMFEARHLFLFAPWASGLLLLLRRKGPAAPRTWRRWSFVGFALAGAYAAIVLATTATGGLGRRVFSEAHSARRLGFAGAHLLQGLRFVGELGRSSLDDDERDRVFAALDHVHASAPSEHKGVAKGADLLLLQVEALQAWAVDAQVGGEPVMPFLSSARSEARWYSNVFDQAAQGRTSDAEYLVLASGHALPEGALAFLRSDNGFRTLMHALADAGYSTYSAHPYQQAFWNRSLLHPAYGFARSDFAAELGPGREAGWGLADGPFLQRVAERSGGLPRPSAALAITLSLHHPYESFPPPLCELELGALEGTGVGNYLQAMRYFDRSLEAMFAQLKVDGRLEHTLVVLYGDHITGLEYDDDVLRLAGVSAWSPDIAARLRRVAAFIWVPGGELRGESSLIGGQIDLGVTALHLLGVDSPASAVGTPLVGKGPGFAAMPDGGAVDAEHLLVRRGMTDPAGRCFAYPQGTPLPRPECDALDARAAAQLEVARAVLDHDLYMDAEARQ